MCGGCLLLLEWPIHEGRPPEGFLAPDKPGTELREGQVVAGSKDMSVFWKLVQSKGGLISELLCVSESFAMSRGRVGPALFSGLPVSPSPACGFRVFVWFPCRTKMDVLMQSRLGTGALGILGA